MFVAVYTAEVYLGLVVSTLFVVGWLVLYFKGRVNPDRVPYSALSIIDFIGLPMLAMVAFVLTGWSVYEHGVLPSPTLTYYAQRLVIFTALDLLVVLRLVRFVAAYRDGHSPKVVGAPTPSSLDRNRADAAS